MTDLFSLKNKIAVVTGGYGYLGSTMVSGLIDFGANVVVAARNKEKYEMKFLNKKNVHFQNIDISSTESIKAGFEKINRDFGKIDILVNNAFYVSGGNPESISDDEWSNSMDGTINSVHRTIREVIPFMKQKNEGAIINISSMYGVEPPDFNVYKGFEDFLNPPDYGVAKAAVIHFTKYYAKYLSKYNIKVNCISPGAFPSPEVQKYEGFIKNLEQKALLGRIGQPEELVGALVFLSSKASSYVTGQNIIVDGGWTI